MNHTPAFLIAALIGNLYAGPIGACIGIALYIPAYLAFKAVEE